MGCDCGREIGGGDGGQDGRHVASGDGFGGQGKRGALDLDVQFDGRFRGGLSEAGAETSLAFQGGQREAIEKFGPAFAPGGRYERGRNEQGIAHGAKGPGLERAADRVPAHQGEVNDPIGQTLHRLGSGQVEELEPDIWELVAKLIEARHHKPLDRAFPAADDDFDGLIPTLPLEIRERGAALAGDGVEAGAGCSKDDAAAFAADEFSAEELLEFLDLAAEEALPGGVALRGPGDAAGLGYEAEALQTVQGQPALLEQFRKHDSKVMVFAKGSIEKAPGFWQIGSVQRKTKRLERE